MAMKYVIFTATSSVLGKTQTHEIPILFSGAVIHKDALPRGVFKDQVVAAGFFHVVGNQVVVWENPSDSLKIGPREQDAIIIGEELFGQSVSILSRVPVGK